MRRTAIALTLAALVAGMYACSSDAPTAPRGGGGTPSSAIQVQLYTSNANPDAGTCTLMEAVVTLNGSSVPDGTGVAFSTDYGTFSQSGLPLVSVVTTGGTATTALCGPGAGTSKVKATVTIAGKTGTATLSIVFQASSGTLPFVSSCSPSFGSTQGNETLTINGGRFFGTPSTTRIQFTANGITRDGIVTGVTANAVTAQTPGFPELTAPTTLTAITLTFGTNLATPTTLSLPSCFAYGTASASTPTITALLPASGTNEGSTRVTIVGSGFSTTSGVQVFFGDMEATVVSVTFSQIVVLTPRQFGDPTAVDVTVRNIGSGAVSNALTYTYTLPLAITAFSNNVQPLYGPFSPMTIYGRGFQAPVAVTLAGWGAYVQSVSATELVVVPGPAVPNGCDDITGDISVTNINTGASTTGGSFTYKISKPGISGVTPTNSCPNPGTDCPNNGFGGGPATITGVNFPVSPANVEVKFGAQTAFVNNATSTQLDVTVPTTAQAAPACSGSNPPGTYQVAATVDVTVTDRTTTCSVTAAQAYQFLLPCAGPAPAPTPTP
jgi:hypothetical protein